MALHTCDSCIYYLFIYKQNIIFILCYELHFIMYDTVMTGQRRVDPFAVRFIRQRQNQTGNGQRAQTGISEVEQRRKQYQAGVEVTSTGSEFQCKAVRGQTQK